MNLIELTEQHYNLENPIIVKKLGGLSSDNYHIKDDNGEYVLKCLKDYDLADLTETINITKYLYGQNLPISMPLLSKFEEYFCMIGNQLLILYKKIDGEILHEENFNQISLEASAKLLADFHNKCRNYKISSIKNHEITDIYSWKNFDNDVINTSLETKKNLFSSLSRYVIKTNLRTVIHGDFHNENILFNEQNEITSLLDFEEVKYGHPIEDIMHFILLACCNSGFEKENISKAKIFANKYLSLYSLAVEEIFAGIIIYLISSANSTFLEEKYLETKDELFIELMKRDIKKWNYFIDNFKDFIEKVFIN